MTTVLLVSWGRGNGHITRLRRIGRAFAAEGWRSVFLSHTSATHVAALDDDDASVTYYPDWADTADPWTRWSDPEFLSRSVDFDRTVIRAVSPDRIVNDNRLSMLIAAQLEGIPVTSLCQDNQLPGHRYAGKDVAEIWIFPVSAVNRLMSSHGLPGIHQDVRELFARGRIAIPGTPEFEPVESQLAGALDVVHTGPLTPLISGPPALPQDLLFYRTVGSIEDDFVRAFEDWPGTIYVATGEPRAVAQPGIDRVRLAPLWDLAVIGAALRAVVHHGGHGTTTACIAAGIPAVILPGHNPERFANGLRAQDRDLARVLPPDSVEGTRWGPAVDTTGDRPAWSLVRRAIDTLPARRQDRPSMSSDVLTDAALVRLLA
ncbi:UDP:flavonoid glycosyltransferase YjiC, YdhE family [Microbacterium azadirachtae]|uniref:UDP:flavonoid glycosyltransferase YjiC, YdhE family n=2 Tax=Microbacterium azadirachtae TaxID=582680 RepID=A0A1I6FZU0_9MICO|nr:UDP:flavonoid glycosyltransferase YjiC, YdhE family [Microbacterium azadirachtae]